MADVSKIQLPNGTTYDIKDKTSGYITSSDIPTDVSYFVNDSGYTVATVANHTLFLSPSVSNGDGVSY
jgi:hypothetical protein